MDPLVNNPLAQAQGSAWSKYVELRQLQKDITRDLERLNPADEYFRQVLFLTRLLYCHVVTRHLTNWLAVLQEHVQVSMLRVLTVWACLHPALSYRQGMHELLAPIIKVLDQDAAAHGVSSSADVAEDEFCLAALLNARSPPTFSLSCQFCLSRNDVFN